MNNSPKESGQPNYKEIDFASIKIDPVGTKKFLAEKQKERGSNDLKLGFDKYGKKVLLKTSIFFRDTETSEMLRWQEFKAMFPDLGIEGTAEAFFEQILDDLRNEMKALRLAEALRIPVANAGLVIIEEIPYLALEFLEGISDRGINGQSIDFTLEANQGQALAQSALFKFLTDQTGDSGQYLQNISGNIYLSDIRLNLSVATSYDIQENLLEILAQGVLLDVPSHPEHRLILSSGYFSSFETTLKSQIDGLSTQGFNMCLQGLELLSEDEIL